MRFHKWATPIAGWFTIENPMNKWMMTGGTPISGNPQIIIPTDSYFSEEVGFNHQPEVIEWISI